jgi:hypothetical protein
MRFARLDAALLSRARDEAALLSLSAAARSRQEPYVE